jgi:hypothetical protein
MDSNYEDFAEPRNNARTRVSGTMVKIIKGIIRNRDTKKKNNTKKVINYIFNRF